MSDWNSTQYLKFKKERTQPSIDLASSIEKTDIKTIADIGCGPGNSTAVLASIFSEAEIVGIDSSEDMIKKASIEHPELKFKLCDVSKLTGNYDLLFSNACLQWVPEHHKLIPFLMSKLNSSGVLAVQMPINIEEPLYQIIKDVSQEPEWGFQNAKLEVNETLSTKEYYNILSSCSSYFRIWETKYYHTMDSHEAMLDWVKGARLRPYLDFLGKEKGISFEKKILERTKELYNVMDNGKVVFGFKRLFFVAEK